MNKKILFLDLDGTLLNDEKEITEGNRLAIQEAVAAGHKVVICSGRALSCGLEFADMLQLTGDGCYIIAYNGCCIYDVYHKKILHQEFLPMSVAKKIYKTAFANGLHTHAYQDDFIYSEHDTEALHRYSETTHLPFKIEADACAVMPRDPYKMLVVDYHSRANLEVMKEQLDTWDDKDFEYYFSCDQLLEIVPTGVNKGNAIRRLSDLLGFSLDDTISAGDAENDIAMLQTTKISVVMANANEYMRQYATYVTEHDNNHDGIAEIIYKFML